MVKRTKEGYCSICGEYRPLSFEHVPPKAAFNDRKIVLKSFEKALHQGLDYSPKGGRHMQRGAGYHSLCANCNNNTGAYYGRYYVDWAYQGIIFAKRTNGKGSMHLPFFIFPLRIIKQIITMFFSINGESFRKANPDLVKFVLDPYEVYLPPKYKVYCYLHTEGVARYTGVSAKGSFSETLSFNKPLLLSELSFPPFGYLLVFDNDEPPDNRLYDITWFSRFQYNDFKDVFLRFHRLPTHLVFPGDYRTKEEIQKQAESSRNLDQ